MQISMFTVRVRFVSDAKGPLEAKPKRAVLTLARDLEEALHHAHTQFAEVEAAGVVVEYDRPSQLPDTFATESLVYS